MGDWDKINMEETEPIEPEGLDFHEAIRSAKNLNELHMAVSKSRGIISPELGGLPPLSIINRMRKVFNEALINPSTLNDGIERELSFDDEFKEIAGRFIKEALKIKPTN